MMFRDGSWWFVMIRGGSWWFVVVCGGSWWFVMVHDVFFSRERSCDPLFNQSESQIHYQLSFWMRLRDGSWWFIRDGFVVVRDVSWWFVVVRDDSWWFVMVRGGSWWFVVVRDDSWWFVMFFSLEKGHVTLFSTNQSPKFTINSHFGWDFVMVRDGFVVVRDSSWRFMMFYSLEKGHVTLFSTNQRPKFTMKSHFWWDFVFAPFHLKRIPLKSSAKNQLTTRNGFCCLCLFWGSGTWWIHSSLSFSSFWIKYTLLEYASLTSLTLNTCRIARFIHTVCMRRIRWSCEGLTSVHHEYTGYTLKHLLLRHMYNLSLPMLKSYVLKPDALRLPTGGCSLVKCWLVNACPHCTVWWFIYCLCRH